MLMTLVIFSSSPEGLQQKLNALEKYCDDWGMQVNSNKTQVIIFNKAGRIIKHKFCYKNFNIECVPSYKYLGIYFTASGTFSLAKVELHKKGIESLFQTTKRFPESKPRDIH